MSDNSKENWKNFFAVTAGTITGFLIAAFFLFFGRVFEGISNEWWGVVIIAICFLVVPCFWAGYVTSIKSTKNDNRHVIITGSLLLLIALINSDFSAGGGIVETLFFVFLVFAMTLLGGTVGLRRKKKAI